MKAPTVLALAFAGLSAAQLGALPTCAVRLSRPPPVVSSQDMFNWSSRVPLSIITSQARVVVARVAADPR